jgi:hypothetical protein
MKRFFVIIGVSLFLVGSLAIRPTNAADLELTPTDDTTIKKSSPETSFADAPGLDMLYESGTDSAAVPLEVQESLVKFDLSALPKGVYITGAMLHLTGYGSSQYGYGDIRIRRIISGWNQSTTWSNRPSYAGTSEANSEITANVFPQGIDILPLVQDWYSGHAPNYGMVLRAFGDADYNGGLYEIEDAHASSKEGPIPPRLTVTYSNTPPTPAPSSSTTPAPKAVGLSPAPGDSPAGGSNPSQAPAVATEETVPLCNKSIEQLIITKTQTSLAFSFTTSQPVIGRLYYYDKSKIEADTSGLNAAGFTENSKSFTDNQPKLTHQFTVQGFSPNQTVYYTIVAGTEQECEHATAALSEDGTSPSIFGRISKGIEPSASPTKLHKKNIQSNPFPYYIKQATRAVTGGKRVSFLAWLAIFLGLIIPFLLGHVAAARVQRWYTKLFNLRNFVLKYSRKKKVRGTWGRVMSSLNMKGIPGAVISLYNAKTKTLVDQTFSDERGLYGFFVDPAEYYITIKHAAYTFPPVLMPYAYQGGTIKVENLEGVTHLDVALDPALLTDSKLKRIESLLLRLEPLRLVALSIGSLAVIASVLLDRTLLSLALLALFGFYLHREYQRKDEARYCFVFRSANDALLSFAQMSIKTTQGRIVFSKVIDKTARAYVSIPAGNYIVDVTTYPIPGRPSISHARHHVSLSRGFFIKTLVIK